MPGQELLIHVADNQFTVRTSYQLYASVNEYVPSETSLWSHVIQCTVCIVASLVVPDVTTPRVDPASFWDQPRGDKMWAKPVCST